MLHEHGVSALAQDVQYLIEFVDSLENGQMLRQNLDELQQTVDLMQSENSEEFFERSPLFVCRRSINGRTSHPIDDIVS